MNRARRGIWAPVLLLCALALAAAPLIATAWAVEPDEILEDPALEARARALSQELRCLVCQNQSIDDSNAELAKDLRIIVRERLVAGDSDRQVLDYLVKRYGDFVLLRPPFKPQTYVIWFGPAIFLLLGGLAVFFYLRRRPSPAAAGGPGLGGADPDELDAAERQRLQELLKD